IQASANGQSSSSNESADSDFTLDGPLSNSFLKEEQSPARVLDLCCGQGRHALQLAREYPHLTICGHDQSSFLISLAKERAAAAGLTVNTTFTVGDCRSAPYPDEHFQLILVLGNSFGYFDADSGDRAFLDEVYRLLAPGGHVVLDLVDGGYMRENFAERSWEWVDDSTFVCRERALSRDAKRLLSREVVTVADHGVVRDQFYQERLYSRSEITDLLESSGLLDVAKLNDGGYGTNSLLRYEASYGSSSSCSSNETDSSVPPVKPSPAEIVTAAKDMSKRKEDLGMMEQRMFIFAMKPTWLECSEADEHETKNPEEIVIPSPKPKACRFPAKTDRRGKSKRQASRASRSSSATASDEEAEGERGGDPADFVAAAPPEPAAVPRQVRAPGVRAPPAFPAPFTVILGDPRIPCPGKLNDTWNPEDYDTRRRLIDALVEMGYPRSSFEVLDDHSSLVADLCAQKPGFVFNLCDEGFGNDALKELHVPALLETLGAKYSGAGPVCLGICFDKGLVNRTAKALGVPTPRETYYLAENASTRFLADPGSSPSPDFYDPVLPASAWQARESSSKSLTPCTQDITAVTTAIATEIGYPCFIKPMRGDNSIGITTRSIIHTPAEAASYIRELRGMDISDVIIQEYLEGPEYGVGVIGNLVHQDGGTGTEGNGLRYLPTMKVCIPRPALSNLRNSVHRPAAETTPDILFLPPPHLCGYPTCGCVQVDFSRIVDLDLPPILGFESKWNPASPYWSAAPRRVGTAQKKKQKKNVAGRAEVRYVPAQLPAETEAALRTWCAVLFERFGCRDYARFDFRADSRGAIKLLEVNPNPGWCWDGKLAHMGEFEGSSYPDVLREVLEAAHRRCFPPEEKPPAHAAGPAAAVDGLEVKRAWPLPPAAGEKENGVAEGGETSPPP
ncbi:MAG: hypothetical protein BJ554DRAFT_4402, partial [Olpidium bornovanus]